VTTLVYLPVDINELTLEAGTAIIVRDQTSSIIVAQAQNTTLSFYATAEFSREMIDSIKQVSFVQKQRPAPPKEQAKPVVVAPTPEVEQEGMNIVGVVMLIGIVVVAAGGGFIVLKRIHKQKLIAQYSGPGSAPAVTEHESFFQHVRGVLQKMKDQ